MERKVHEIPVCLVGFLFHNIAFLIPEMKITVKFPLLVRCGLNGYFANLLLEIAISGFEVILQIIVLLHKYEKYNVNFRGNLRLVFSFQTL